MGIKTKGFIASHSKSSAALISLGIHAVIFLVAVSFVAVTVIQKKDTIFEAKPVSRPRMQLKKLQVPVKIKKKNVHKPKLRKRIVVQPKTINMPDISMPEISGVKGGLGNADGAGLGAAGGIGFSMPEINLFGIKGRGEKVFIILDASPSMMTDEMGGIPAYSLIKAELLRVLDELGPTTLFNIMVFEGNEARQLFPNMVAASPQRIGQVRAWIEPLNQVSKGMGDRDYGLKTLGSGEATGVTDVQAGAVTRKRTWLGPALHAQMNKADTIFLLTNGWGAQTKSVGKGGVSREAWYQTSAGKKWQQALEKGKKLLAEENQKRREKGQPPRVIGSSPHSIVRAYFPGVEGPPNDEIYHYTPKDIANAFELARRQNAGAGGLAGGKGRLRDSKKDAFSFSVIHFVKAGGETAGSFKELSSLCAGAYSKVEGLDAIEAYVSAPKVSER